MLATMVRDARLKDAAGIARVQVASRHAAAAASLGAVTVAERGYGSTAVVNVAKSVSGMDSPTL